MNRRVIAFDLDDTLAITKSPLTPQMADLLSRLLMSFDACVISGGTFAQFETQLLKPLALAPELCAHLHLLPTSGTRYYRFDSTHIRWVEQYAENLTTDEKASVVAVLTAGAKHLGFWEPQPYGDIVEDRGSQITFSALGQQAPPAVKYAWDRDGTKKEALRAYTADRLPDLSVRAGGTTSVDVTRKGIDKAYGMRKLMDILDLNPGEILFFGDQLQPGGNDYPVSTVGIDTIAVRDSQETAVAMQAILAVTETLHPRDKR